MLGGSRGSCRLAAAEREMAIGEGVETACLTSGRRASDLGCPIRRRHDRDRVAALPLAETVYSPSTWTGRRGGRSNRCGPAVPRRPDRQTSPADNR